MARGRSAGDRRKSAPSGQRDRRKPAVAGEQKPAPAAEPQERTKLPDLEWVLGEAPGQAKPARARPDADAETVREAAALVRRARARTKLSLATFAQRIGVSADMVRDWEIGKRAPQGPARALLVVLDHAPELALSILRHAEREER